MSTDQTRVSAAMFSASRHQPYHMPTDQMELLKLIFIMES